MAEGGADVDGAVVEEGDVFDDGEAEAGAAVFAGAVLVDAVEAFEEAGEVFGGDAAAAVGDGEDGVAVFGFEAEGDGGGAGVAEGVGEEVDEGLLEEVGVAADGEGGEGVGVGEELDAGAVGVVLDEGEGVGGEGVEADLGEVVGGGGLAALDGGEGEDVLDEVVEAAGLSGEDVVAVFAAGVVEGDFGEGLDGGEDGGEGGLDLVGDVGDEVGAEGLVLISWETLATKSERKDSRRRRSVRSVRRRRMQSLPSRSMRTAWARSARGVPPSSKGISRPWRVGSAKAPRT